MLVGFIRACFSRKSFCIAAALVIAFIPLNKAVSGENQVHSTEFAWVQDYFDSLDESSSLEEITDFLVNLKLFLDAEGYNTPSLIDLSLWAKKYFHYYDIDIDEEIFEKIQEKFENESTILPAINNLRSSQDFCIWQIDSKKHKSIFSKDLAIAFCEFIGGALLMAVPIPGASIVGGGMMADAGRRAYNQVKEVNKKNSKSSLAEGEKDSSSPRWFRRWRGE